MKISGNDIRPGNVIEHRGRLMLATRVQHTQPGKGGAYMQVELKDIRDGTKLNERFRSSESVERVRLDQRPYQYLYAENDGFVFMDTETYDQIGVDREMVGEQAVFLQEGMEVTIESHEGTPITVLLPETVVATVVDTEAVVRGQTAASSFKPAQLDNGVRVMVPPFVEPGKRIVVNTADGTYRERARD
ncbi:MAG: elongation factor P [Alphaproteobacteria bacterium]